MIRPLRAAAFIALALCAGIATSAAATRDIRVIVLYDGKRTPNVDVMMTGTADFTAFRSVMATNSNGSALIPIRKNAKGKLCFTAVDLKQRLRADEECVDEPWPPSVELTLRP